jgi:hypothetical protein
MQERKFGIPVSGKDPIHLELGSITYLLRHAIGPVETKIRAIQYSIYNISAYMPEAIKAIDAENTGKVWADGERMEAISKMANQLANDAFWVNYTSDAESKRRDEIFNIICDGWEGECYKLEDGEKPADHVRATDKQHIVEWWMSTQLELSGDDQKNSERQPDADSRKLPE